MTVKYLREGTEYSVELIEIGKTEEGHMTADDESWVNGQTHWNIWVSSYNAADLGLIDEIMDIDIPVEYPVLAEEIYDLISRHAQRCNRQRIEFG